jgi:Flp pilus assembly protein TadB
MDLLIAFAVFLLFAGVGTLLANRQSDRAAASERLSEVAHSVYLADPLARLGPRSRAAADLFESKPRFDPMRRLEQQMWQAGMYQGAYQALLAMGGLMAAGAGLGMLVAGDVLIAIGLGLGLAIIPLLYIRFKRGRRLKAFLIQLPFALDLLKSTL